MINLLILTACQLAQGYFMTRGYGITFIIQSTFTFFVSLSLKRFYFCGWVSQKSGGGQYFAVLFSLQLTSHTVKPFVTLSKELCPLIFIASLCFCMHMCMYSGCDYTTLFLKVCLELGLKLAESWHYKQVGISSILTRLSFFLFLSRVF